MSTFARFGLRLPEVRVLKTPYKRIIDNYIDKTRKKELADKIFSDAIGGEAGSRCWPKGNKMSGQVGFRVDVGEQYIDKATGDKVRGFNLQLNKDSQDKSIAELAAKKSHEKRICFHVPSNVTDAEVLQFVEELLANIRENGL
ncbi:hypothetical protein H0H93_009594 [Arthromyces matolae]|nr:hypothetical protein H0H93_009594 [Arthromyces matolae]